MKNLVFREVVAYDAVVHIQVKKKGLCSEAGQR